MIPATMLDPAVAAIDQAIETVRYDRPDPADLSAVIAGLRELFWHTTTLTNTLTHAYDTASDLVHDNGGDPAVALTAVADGLHAVAEQLAGIDQALNSVHCQAAHLFRR